MSEFVSRLPARPSLEQLRKQAKDLLRDYRTGDIAVAERFRAVAKPPIESGTTPDATPAVTIKLRRVKPPSPNERNSRGLSLSEADLLSVSETDLSPVFAMASSFSNLPGKTPTLPAAGQDNI